MTAPRRVLVTGPIGRAGEYAAAAVDAGWRVDVLELLRIERRPFDAGALPEWLDLVCITSKHALEALESVLPRHRAVPAAVVGDATARRVRELGFALALAPAPGADELAARLAATLTPRSVVLWPRGSRSDDLATKLRETGATVLDPVVYETSVAPATDAIPETEAVFFASPSAVDAYAARGVERGQASVAIAIGPTTATALRNSSVDFATVLPLERPTPRAFAQCLEDLGDAPPRRSDSSRDP